MIFFFKGLAIEDVMSAKLVQRLLKPQGWWINMAAVIEWIFCSFTPVIRNQKYMCMGTCILQSNYFYPRFHAVLEILLGAQRLNAFFNLQNTVFLFKLKDDTMKMWYTCILIIYMHLLFFKWLWFYLIFLCLLISHMICR